MDARIIFSQRSDRYGRSFMELILNEQFFQ